MFSENERKRRLDAASKLIKRENLVGMYLIGNSVVGTNAFGCFRYFVDNRVTFFCQSVVILPGGEPVAVVNNAMSRINLEGKSFVRRCVENLDQLGGVIDILKSEGMTRGKLGVLLEVLPASWLMRLNRELPELECVDVSEKIFDIRTQKSGEEVAVQRECAKMADAAYKTMCEKLRPGILESELIAEMDRTMQHMGMEESFMLVTSGRFSAKENAMPTLHNTASVNRRIERGDSVALEITPRFMGYWTQIVRTVSVGEYNADLDEFRRVTVGAIEAAKTALKTGNTIGALVTKMREYIEGEGYVLAMPCGHIAAVDLNEERLDEANSRLLLPGMLVIIHPTVLNHTLKSGIYWGESYLVTEEGYEAPMRSETTLFTA